MANEDLEEKKKQFNGILDRDGTTEITYKMLEDKWASILKPTSFFNFISEKYLKTNKDIKNAIQLRFLYTTYYKNFDSNRWDQYLKYNDLYYILKVAKEQHLITQKEEEEITKFVEHLKEVGKEPEKAYNTYRHLIHKKYTPYPDLFSKEYEDAATFGAIILLLYGSGNYSKDTWEKIRYLASLGEFEPSIYFGADSRLPWNYTKFREAVTEMLDHTYKRLKEVFYSSNEDMNLRVTAHINAIEDYATSNQNPNNLSASAGNFLKIEDVAAIIKAVFQDPEERDRRLLLLQKAFVKEEGKEFNLPQSIEESLNKEVCLRDRKVKEALEANEDLGYRKKLIEDVISFAVLITALNVYTSPTTKLESEEVRKLTAMPRSKIIEELNKKYEKYGLKINIPKEPSNNTIDLNNAVLLRLPSDNNPKNEFENRVREPNKVNNQNKKIKE